MQLAYRRSALPAMLLHLLLLRVAPAAAEVQKGTSVQAVQKVIELLQGMEAKAKEEKNAEAVSYAEFEQFCKGTAVNKQNEIDAGNLLIEELTSQTEKLDSDIAGLENKIAGLKQDVEVYQADLKATAEQREKDNAMYTARIMDQGESWMPWSVPS
jgi:chromosome segregation ATPase